MCCALRAARLRLCVVCAVLRLRLCREHMCKNTRDVGTKQAHTHSNKTAANMAQGEGALSNSNSYAEIQRADDDDDNAVLMCGVRAWAWV